MKKSVLIVVHPGYAASRYFISDKYGNYDDYISQLTKAVWSENSIILLHNGNKGYFGLPSKAKVIRDYDDKLCPKALISTLKRRKVDKVEVCGEFLWWYSGDIGENLKKYFKDLPSEKRIPLKEALDRASEYDNRFVIKFGLDPREFAEKVFFTGDNVNKGCVKSVYDWLLREEFPVELRKELCYPTVDTIQ